MRVAYFYFMKQEADRVRAAAPGHASYWQRLTLADYRGGPFADRSGGLIVFDSESKEHAERLVSGDPFLREGLLDSTGSRSGSAIQMEAARRRVIHGIGRETRWWR
jgi:uncharacterized protein YciI